MTYADAFNLRTTNVSFNNVADAIDGTLSRIWGGTTTGTSTAYACSPSPSFAAYSAGDVVIVTPHTTSTGPSTLNISALGTKTIKYCGQDLVGGELVANVEAILVYDAAGVLNLLNHGGGWASWTPTYTAVAGTFTSVTTSTAIYQRHGNRVEFAVKASGTTSAGTADLRFSLPIIAADTGYSGGGTIFDGTTDYSGYWILANTSIVSVRNYNTSSLGAGINRSFAVTGLYKC